MKFRDGRTGQLFDLRRSNRGNDVCFQRMLVPIARRALAFGANVIDEEGGSQFADRQTVSGFGLLGCRIVPVRD